ncbi:Diphthamide biosynthesis protein 4 [Emydomyces testavorans]|uniref:Diphthamide biosynthesis protein 4 n=1 Tax=Emydomyces testavorans TaxID=2070801 RepID=A0AAF0DJI2_9EURO|nr:Diphthamide biosynthesis protein 4 [Emydomyces testavorans]
MSFPAGEWASHTTYYDILEVPPPPVLLSQSDLKAAYHRALLKYHPDKSSPSSPASYVTTSVQTCTLASNVSSQNSRIYTIDQITTAYKLLSDPRKKAEYDRSLYLSDISGVGSKRFVINEKQAFCTGLEVFDLDDMQVGMDSEGSEFWYRNCRCGDTKGFLIHEEDLENEMERGEIMLGCQGCSLWAKILFAVNQGEQEDREMGRGERSVDGNS